MEVEATLPLPNMSDISELLKEEHIRKVYCPSHHHTLTPSHPHTLTPSQLCSKLPYQAVGHDWVLIYSTCKHGISLRTLYRNMAGYEETPVLLVVRDQNKKVRRREGGREREAEVRWEGRGGQRLVMRGLDLVS